MYLNHKYRDFLHEHIFKSVVESHIPVSKPAKSASWVSTPVCFGCLRYVGHCDAICIGGAGAGAHQSLEV